MGRIESTVKGGRPEDELFRRWEAVRVDPVKQGWTGADQEGGGPTPRGLGRQKFGEGKS